MLLLSAAGSLQSTLLETFEGAAETWQVARDVSGAGVIAAVSSPVASGLGAARLATTDAGQTAQLRVSFADAAATHTWQERPGTFRWQRARIYVPSTSVAALGPFGVLTLGGFWPSATPAQGWFLRVRAGGQLSVQGTRDDGANVEFPAYATVPVDRWFTLELGLHSQQGPGVKRAFAFFVDGVAHGWYRQGRMTTETYDRVAVGILASTAAAPVELFVDDWGTAGSSPLPTGPDARSTGPLVTKDFRTGSGADWQIDWTTWANDLRLAPGVGLYSNTDRLQSGVALDRAPDLSSGWAEIEIDWPKGRPLDVRPNGYFGPMVGFRKEINREQNLEIIPIGNGDGTVDLVFEAWDGLGPIILARAPLPVTSFGGSAIPEPGDVIRARWTQMTPAALDVRASYYDASANVWLTDLLAGVFDVSAINGINFNDGAHTMSSVTIDSPFYSIRRFHVGTPDTYPGATTCSVEVSPTAVTVAATGGTGSVSVAAAAGCGWTATADPWIALSGAAGSGSGAVGYSVGANPTTTPRLGQIAVGGRVVAVTQAAAPPPPVLPTLQLGNASATEGTATAGTADFVVTLSAASAVPVLVQYSTLAGSALPGADFVAAAGTATIAAGALSTTITVTLVADAVPESTEAFQLALTNPQNAAIADGVGDGTILDDDTATSPVTTTLALAAGGDDVNEIGSTFTVDGSTVFVGNANQASYAGLRFSGVPVPRGAIVSSARVQLRAAATAWNAMQFEWAAEASGNAAAFSATSRPSQRPLGPARVAHVSNVQWTSGTWYTLEELAPLVQAVVARDDWSAGHALALVMRGTGNNWGRKFASAFESGAANAARLVVTYTAAGGPPPPAALSVSDVSMVEGTGTTGATVFTVTLSAPSAQPVTVGYATAGGTATSPEDFTATSGTLTFAPGVTTRTIPVPVVADVAVEANETFALGLSNPVNATLADSSGQATIVNDDTPPLPTVSVNDVTLVEGTGGATSAVFTVALSASSTQLVTVGYAAVNGTATAPADFTSVSGTLSFAAGITTQTVAVPVVTDSVFEPSETLVLALGSPTNATVADGTGQATITNDDVPPVPVLSVNDVTVIEGTGATSFATFTITLSAPSAQAVSVSYATANGTAVSPDDYASTTSTATFAAGATSQAVIVPIAADGVVEPAETFTLGLSAPVNATIADAVGQATISNDDVAAGPTSLTLQVSDGADDVNQEGSAFAATGGTVWVGNGGPSVASFTGLRFTGVGIPRGATITAARLELQAASTQWLTIGFEIGADAAANSPAFSTAAAPSTRTLLAPRATHASNAQWVSGTWYSVADVSALLQSVVTGADWAPGNALSLVLRGTGGAYGRKFMRSFEAGAATAPRLVVSFIAP